MIVIVKKIHIFYSFNKIKLMMWHNNVSDIGGGTLVPGDAAQISKSTLIFSYFMHHEFPEK